MLPVQPPGAVEGPARPTAAARTAVKAAGGTILKENARVGVATVRSSNAGFIAAAGPQSALVGAARNQPIGKAPSGGADKDSVERLTAAERAAVKRSASTSRHAPGQGLLAGGSGTCG
jgi:lantibiotic leader peptide-processing serine protease